jgi:hypothetical protein
MLHFLLTFLKLARKVHLLGKLQIFGEETVAIARACVAEEEEEEHE